ncbi:DUF1707 domain-containing protein [Actinosynnema sp. NPDC020468]|uniref:DUF1707 domain-containing protein n=1 Tax=Actinosynnema sp. NPDC020468 TaxID=3154488 RepID=UPI00340FDBFD
MSEPHQVRIGNQQREEAITALNDHFAAGRLEIEEYQQRVDYATAAQSAQELAALFHDLPHPRPNFLPPPSYSAPPPQDPPPYAQPSTGYAQPGYAQPGYTQPGYAQPGYPPPTAYGHPTPHFAPYGVDPLTGYPLSDKSKIVAGLLQLFLPFGVGRFYIGDTGIGIAQLLTCGGCGVWSLVDGIILLVNGGTDGQGRRLRD